MEFIGTVITGHVPGRSAGRNRFNGLLVATSQQMKAEHRRIANFRFETVGFSSPGIQDTVPRGLMICRCAAKCDPMRSVELFSLRVRNNRTQASPVAAAFTGTVFAFSTSHFITSGPLFSPAMWLMQQAGSVRASIRRRCFSRSTLLPNLYPVQFSKVAFPVTSCAPPHAVAWSEMPEKRVSGNGRRSRRHVRLSRVHAHTVSQWLRC